MRSRNRDELRRPQPFVDPRPRLLICCQDEGPAAGYLDDLRAHLGNRLVQVEAVPGDANPLTLVNYAVQRKQKSERAVRIRKDDILGYDEVWCVFDAASGESTLQATHQADANQIRLAISNPCFELWLLLHFQDRRSPIDRDNVRAAWRDYIKGCDQFDSLLPYHSHAVRRAVELERWHEERGCAGENPSAGVYRLAERIIELSRGERLKQHRLHVISPKLRRT